MHGAGVFPVHFRFSAHAQENDGLDTFVEGNALPNTMSPDVMGLRKMECCRSDQGVSSLGDVPPSGAERLDVAVVAGKSVDPALGADESEFGIPV